MSSDVVLSAALRSNLLSLQGTQRSIDSTQLRLATGLKVNSALDNPQSFFTAQSLSNRASDLQRLLDGIALSVRTIEEADKGVTALTNLVEQASSIASEAQSEARSAEGFAVIRSTNDLASLGALADGVNIVNGTSDIIRLSIVEDNTAQTRTNIDIDLTTTSTVDDIVAAINGNATNQTRDLVKASVTSSGKLQIESTQENAILRLTTTGTQPVTAAGWARLGLENIVNTESNGAAGAVRQSGTIQAGRIIESQVSAAAAVNGQYEASATLNAAGYIGNYATATSDDLQIGLTVDGVTTTVGSYLNTATIQELVDDINGADLGVTASFDTESGQIKIAADDDIASVSVVFSHNDTTSTGDISFGFGSGALGYGTNGGANDVTLATGTNSAISERFTFVGGDVDLAQYESDYDNVRAQIDALVEDANYRGVNLLSGDNLQTFFNEDRSNSLTTDGVDFSASGLGLDAADFTSITNVQLAIDNAKAALDDIRAFGQSIANDLAIIQTRQDFTSSTINTLKAGASDLTAADQNEEGANLLALQTRQQLGVTSLALAAQSQQSVLRLF